MDDDAGGFDDDFDEDQASDLGDGDGDLLDVDEGDEEGADDFDMDARAIRLTWSVILGNARVRFNTGQQEGKGDGERGLFAERNQLVFFVQLRRTDRTIDVIMVGQWCRDSDGAKGINLRQSVSSWKPARATRLKVCEKKRPLAFLRVLLGKSPYQEKVGHLSRADIADLSPQVLGGSDGRPDTFEPRHFEPSCAHVAAAERALPSVINFCPPASDNRCGKAMSQADTLAGIGAELGSGRALPTWPFVFACAAAAKRLDSLTEGSLGVK
ncbi:unnamed protein product, partial [Symbiodinium microadriaticum]